MEHPARLAPDRLLADCDLRFLRRSGPGGQNRNKVETAVILTHRPSGISAEANERRSQAENRRVALFRLRLRLALAVRTDAGPPSSLWQSRRQGDRLVISPTHEDFPALLSEALDHLQAVSYEPAEAAPALGVTASQLLKLLRQEPRALAWLNQCRAGVGLPRLA